MATESPNMIIPILFALSVINPSQAEIAKLRHEAPETLQPPVRSMFVSSDYYLTAQLKYKLFGNWATR